MLSPLVIYLGDVFSAWDSVASWNRWAVELASYDKYHPEGTAYPVLIPAMLAVLYKIQGTSEIWWTAKLSLYVFPISIVFISLVLHRETKNKKFLLFPVLLYPYLINESAINGYVDVPVMLLGMFSLILLYAAEIYKGKNEFRHYVYLAVLLAGITCIIKQSGLVFLLFSYIYMALNYKEFKLGKASLIILLSLSYSITFLIWFLMFSENPAGNLNYLQQLSSANETNDLFKFLLTPTKFSGVLLVLMLGWAIVINKYDKWPVVNAFSVLNGVFVVVGVVVWLVYFSYDGRNALWVKSFLILLFVIYFDMRRLSGLIYMVSPKVLRIHHQFSTRFGFYFKTKKNLPYLKWFIRASAVSSIFIMFLFSDQINWYVYKIQELGQSKIGRPDVAINISHLLRDKDDCVKVVTSDISLMNNYYSREIKDQFVYGSFSEEILEHTCRDGRYILFGQWEVDGVNWAKGVDAVAEGRMSVVNGNHNLLYYIYPNL